MNFMQRLLEAYVAPEMEAQAQQQWQQGEGQRTANAWQGVMDSIKPKPDVAGALYSAKEAGGNDVLNALTQSTNAKKAHDQLAPKLSPVESMQVKLDAMMKSGSPVLQKRALELFGTQSSNKPTSGIQEYQYATQQGFKGSFADWKSANRATTTIQMGDNTIKKDDAVNMIDRDGNPVQVPVGMTYKEAGQKGYRFGKTPTEGEAKQSSSFDVSSRMLGELEDLVDGGADIFGATGLIDKYRSEGDIGGIALDLLMSEAGSTMTPESIKAMSLVHSLSNELIAAYRGAAVGPEEQKKFESQLPMPGQPKPVFKSNLKLTQKNLAELKERRAKVRGISQKDDSSWLPAGFVLAGGQ